MHYVVGIFFLLDWSSTSHPRIARFSVNSACFLVRFVSYLLLLCSVTFVNFVSVLSRCLVELSPCEGWTMITKCLFPIIVHFCTVNETFTFTLCDLTTAKIDFFLYDIVKFMWNVECKYSAVSFCVLFFLRLFSRNSAYWLHLLIEIIRMVIADGSKLKSHFQFRNCKF